MDRSGLVVDVAAGVGWAWTLLAVLAFWVGLLPPLTSDEAGAQVLTSAFNWVMALPIFDLLGFFAGIALMLPAVGRAGYRWLSQQLSH